MRSPGRFEGAPDALLGPRCRRAFLYMSIANRNLVPAYICLVGIPMLGLIGVLDSGHDLRAPLAVRGAWDMQADFHSLAPRSCGALALSSRQRVLEISQSGKQLALALDRMQGLGTIENTTVTAIELRLPGVSCGTGELSVHFQASIESSAGQDVMNGVLDINGCSSCAPVPFRAVRRRERQAER